MQIRCLERLLLCIIGLGIAAGTVRAGGRVCLEAESVTGCVAPMRVIAAGTTNADFVAGASGGKYLEIPKDAGHPPAMTNGEARLTFAVDETAEYTLWGRVYWLSACNSSFMLQVDDSLPFIFGKDATFNAWHWVKQPPRLKVALAKGSHTLLIRNRQDGVKLDQVLFTSDKRYVPVGVEDVTSSGVVP